MLMNKYLTDINKSQMYIIPYDSDNLDVFWVTIHSKVILHTLERSLQNPHLCMKYTFNNMQIITTYKWDLTLRRFQLNSIQVAGFNKNTHYIPKPS